MSSLCPSLLFFTKRNIREKKIKKCKEKKNRRNKHRNISIHGNTSA